MQGGLLSRFLHWQHADHKAEECLEVVLYFRDFELPD